jgi:hypothetical protein
MPFDGTTAKQIRRPKCDPTAAQSALVLDMVELFFRDGAKWAHGRWKAPDGKRCLIGAVRFVRRQVGSNADRAPTYLARAIPAKDGPLLLDAVNAIIGFNDAPGRTYPEIAAVICRAKLLAEADRTAPPCATANRFAATRRRA